MARTYNKAGSKTKSAAPKQAASADSAVKKAAPAAQAKEPAAKSTAGEKAKEPVKKAVMAAPDKQVMKQVVYQPASQILTREVDPSESFSIGDDMPIYYL